MAVGLTELGGSSSHPNREPSAMNAAFLIMRLLENSHIRAFFPKQSNLLSVDIAFLE